MIGIYDSGIGGLGIFNAIKNILPQESIHYFGDTRYFPFGDRAPEEVRAITLRSLKQIAQDCSIIVIACNTSSVADLEDYRKTIGIPIIGVVPVIKMAVRLTKNNIIALLATTNTVTAAYTDKLIQQFAPNKTVFKIACSGLADAIEHDKNLSILQKYLRQINGADVVILGCTHYTLVKGDIQRLVGPDVKVIDSNAAVARQVLRVMEKENLFQPNKQPHYIFECSGDNTTFLEQVRKYVSPPAQTVSPVQTRSSSVTK